jgi:Domain of unknown function (DUF5615)
VTTTSDAGLVGAPDVQQLAYAIANGRVIFTEDRDFLPSPPQTNISALFIATRTRAASAKSFVGSNSFGKFTNRRKCESGSNSCKADARIHGSRL